MARGPCSFRQADATRAARAAIAAGLKVRRIEIGIDGKIVVVIRDTTAENGAAPFDDADLQL